MKTILVVDDEDETRSLMVRIIQRMGPKVVEASCGQEAVELYREHKPDCVFLDIKLPDIEGPQVLEKIREINPQARVYFITGIENKDSAKDKELGVTGYLTKPIEVDSLAEIIQRL